MYRPLVSIITPTKNRCALLSEAMTSVAAQTFEEWEHLIVDDGSIDATIEMVGEVAKGDARVRLIRRRGEQSGANVCRNLGLHESRGEFIIFLDSDDLLRPGCLERRIKLMTNNRNLDFAVYLSGFFIKEIGDWRVQQPEERFGDDLLRTLYFEIPWIITAPIWRRTSLQALNGFDEALPSWQDVDLHLRAICRGMQYLKLPEVDHDIRYQFEEKKVSVLQRRSPEHLQAAEGTLIKFEGYVRNGPGFDWSRQRALSRLYFLLAEQWSGIADHQNAHRIWAVCYKRRFLPRRVYLVGRILLLLKQISPEGEIVRRIINKWIGMVRMRSNPDLISS